MTAQLWQVGPRWLDSADARLRHAFALQPVSCQLPCDPIWKLTQQDSQSNIPRNRAVRFQ